VDEDESKCRINYSEKYLIKKKKDQEKIENYREKVHQDQETREKYREKVHQDRAVRAQRRLEAKH